MREEKLRRSLGPYFSSLLEADAIMLDGKCAT